MIWLILFLATWFLYKPAFIALVVVWLILALGSLITCLAEGSNR